jgi:hypothetical protein
MAAGCGAVNRVFRRCGNKIAEDHPFDIHDPGSAYS